MKRQYKDLGIRMDLSGPVADTPFFIYLAVRPNALRAVWYDVQV